MGLLEVIKKYENKKEYSEIIKELRELIQIKTCINEKNVVNYTCEYFKIDKETMYSTREWNYVTPRKMLMKYLSEEGLTLMHIGRITRKDHTTVLHSIKTLNDEMSYNKKLAETYKNYIKYMEMKRYEEQPS